MNTQIYTHDLFILLLHMNYNAKCFHYKKIHIPFNSINVLVCDICKHVWSYGLQKSGKRMSCKDNMSNNKKILQCNNCASIDNDASNEPVIPPTNRIGSPDKPALLSTTQNISDEPSSTGANISKFPENVISTDHTKNRDKLSVIPENPFEPIDRRPTPFTIQNEKPSDTTHPHTTCDKPTKKSKLADSAMSGLHENIAVLFDEFSMAQ